MYIPYITIGEDMEVATSPLNSNGETIVNIEKPSAKYGFKTFECIIPGYEIKKSYGFTEKEIERLIQFCKDNADLLILNAKHGGLANAHTI